VTRFGDLIVGLKMRKTTAFFVIACLFVIFACPAGVAAAGKNPAPALRALAAVMSDKAEFFDTDGNKFIYLSDFLKALSAEESMPGQSAFVETADFAVVDMDEDRIPEVTLEICWDIGGRDYEVLRCVKSQIYGYRIRGMWVKQLKKDGLFVSQGGAYDYSLGNLRFIGNSWDFNVVFQSKSYPDRSVALYYQDSPVSEQAFTQRMDAIDHYADWYDLSDANIAKYIVNLPAPMDVKPSLSATAIAGRQKYLDGLAYLFTPINNTGKSDAEINAWSVGYYKSWDVELNKIHKLLSKKLSAPDMEKLRVSELQWIKNRDQRASREFANYNKSEYLGAQAVIFQNAALCDVTRMRTYRLIDLYFGFVRLTDFNP